MYRTLFAASVFVIVLALAMQSAVAQGRLPGARILFLSKSEGFEHSVIAQRDNKPSHCDKILKDVLEKEGATFTTTKDASLINAENLKNYDVVVFYTQGDITKPGKDGAPGMGPKGCAELLAWIENGGAFIGYHCASDTFHTPAGGEVTPFLKMVGGEFAGHGGQFVGTLKVTDPSHPAMRSIPQDWKIKDEWYMFRNINTDTIRVLALLEPGDERAKQEMYNVPDYPMIWCSSYGNGKVYFNGMGHREDLWENPTYQKGIIDGAEWVLDKETNPEHVKPNYDEVVPKDKPEG